MQPLSLACMTHGSDDTGLMSHEPQYSSTLACHTPSLTHSLTHQDDDGPLYTYATPSVLATSSPCPIIHLPLPSSYPCPIPSPDIQPLRPHLTCLLPPARGSLSYSRGSLTVLSVMDLLLEPSRGCGSN